MRWKQFFTPVDSIDVVQGRKLVADTPPGQITILDVRQPKEYEDGHLPGAKLIPLPQLSDRVPELDPDQTIMTYCAVGGRSRVAAQMLSGKGFKKIYNLAGELVRDVKDNEITKTAPKYEFKWNLFTDDNNIVASGIYIYILELKELISGEKATVKKKMAIIK